jgi:hypothetical protein
MCNRVDTNALPLDFAPKAKALNRKDRKENLKKGREKELLSESDHAMRRVRQDLVGQECPTHTSKIKIKGIGHECPLPRVEPTISAVLDSLLRSKENP